MSAKASDVPAITEGQVGRVAFCAPIQTRLVANHPTGACGAHTPLQLPGPSGPSLPASWHCVGLFAHGSGLLHAAQERTRGKSEERTRIGLVITVGSRR